MYHPLWSVGLLLVCFAIFTVVLNMRHRRKITALNTARPKGLAVLKEQVEGLVDPTIVDEIASEIIRFNAAPVSIQAQDHLISDYDFDSSEVEDLVESFAKKYNIKLSAQKPIFIPEDATVLQILQICSALKTPSAQAWHL